MNLLQYTSKEMFSSTELIRKSKTVFDKISSKQIEKAVILRDGKPSFMLMDFEKYEDLISKYIELEDEIKSLKENKKTVKAKQVNDDTVKAKESIPNSGEDINNKDLEAALQRIEELDLKSPSTKLTQSTQNEESVKEENKLNQKQPLNDFWE
ncbi:MAG: hypothetical protein ACQERD_07585 [Campylobacterota bacterium]